MVIPQTLKCRNMSNVYKVIFIIKTITYLQFAKSSQKGSENNTLAIPLGTDFKF